MSIAYIVTVFLVIVLLLSIPLFPFWKVWIRLKTHHPGIWDSKGPFDLLSLVAMPSCVRSFLGVIEMAEKDEAIRRGDPYLVKWCAMAREIRGLLPRSFLGQVGYFLVFFYFTGLLTSVLLAPFKH